MTVPRPLIASLCILVMFFSTACAKKTWQASWSKAGPAVPSQQAAERYEIAMDKYNTAHNRDTLLESISAYKAVLELDPGHRDSLSQLSNQYILLGTAYTQGREEKRECFQKAMVYSELAMYTNPAFKQAVDSGKRPWEAADTLEKENAPAMLFWTTALQYEFKESMGLLGKIQNVGWMNHGTILLDRIKKVAPEFGPGAVEFAYTINYCCLPESQGGDIKKCEYYMEQAIARSEDENCLLPRWGRGKYYYQFTGDIETSISDLQWVSVQNISQFKDAYPWRVHFIEDAAIQLKKLKD